MIELNNFSCCAVSGGNAVMVYPGTQEDAEASSLVALGVILGGVGAYVGGRHGPVGVLAGALIGAIGIPAATTGICKGLAATYRYIGLI